MRDITRRLAASDVQVVIEMVRRQAFGYSELLVLYNELADKELKPELQQALHKHLRGGNLEPQPAWLAALANGDRQIAIHAVVNAKMTDAELEKFEKLLRLQKDGHLVRQVRVAIELEQNRRRIGGKRSPRNRITTTRG